MTNFTNTKMHALTAHAEAGKANADLSQIAPLFGTKIAGQFKHISITATEGQTAFDISAVGSYVPGTGSLILVTFGAVPQRSGAGYTETSATVITADPGLSAGTIFYAMWFETAFAQNNLVEVSGNKTLTLADSATIQNCTAAAAITVPPDTTAFVIGDEIGIKSATTGDVTLVAGSDVTIDSFGGYLKLAGQYAGATLKKIAANRWWLVGNLKA